MHLFILLLSLTFKSWAVANFEGRWIATEGEVVSTLGLNSKCSRIEIIIKQTTNEIITEKYESTCELYGSTWGPVLQTIKDGKVYEHDELVGTIDEESLLTTAPSGTVFYIYNLSLISDSSGQIQLKAEYGVRNYLGTLLTTARLSRHSL
jgi:hypothetical protein